MSDVKALTRDAVAQKLGVGLTAFTQMETAGLIGPMPRKFNRKLVRYSGPEIDAWIEANMPSRREWQEAKESTNA